MEISTYEAWLEEDRQDRERLAATQSGYVQGHLDTQKELDQNRRELLITFPYSLVAKGLFDEYDYACRWCWQFVSPENGPCSNWQSEYPVCPLVLETAYIPSGKYKNLDGKLVPYTRKAYRDPGGHEHQGEWSSLWLGKTDYNYGFCEYFFANEADYARCLAAFSTFTWDESWDKEEAS